MEIYDSCNLLKQRKELSIGDWCRLIINRQELISPPFFDDIAVDELESAFHLNSPTGVKQPIGTDHFETVLWGSAMPSVVSNRIKGIYSDQPPHLTSDGRKMTSWGLAVDCSWYQIDLNFVTNGLHQKVTQVELHKMSIHSLLTSYGHKPFEIWHRLGEKVIQWRDYLGHHHWEDPFGAAAPISRSIAELVLVENSLYRKMNK